MAISTYAGNKILDHLAGKTSFTMPAAVAVALCTADPTASGTGASMNELANANGYARKTTSGSDWSAGSGLAHSNAAAMAFPEATGPQGTATHFAVLDSAAHGAGNILFFGPLSASLAITSGMTPTFAIGELDGSIA